MTCRHCLLLMSCLLLCSLPHLALAQQWTRFRGPNGAGLSDATGIPVTWTAADYRWRVKLPGIGHSSPVVAGERIFVTSAIEDDATRIVRCLNVADGGLIWKRSFDSTTYEKNKLNGYMVSTPALDAECVYMTWTTPREYTAVALTQDKGRLLWQRSVGQFESQHGSGASPILFEEMLILVNDQLGASSAIGLDRATGKTRWKIDRRAVKAAYSTPCIYRPKNGEPQLILSSTAHGMSSHDPHTGRTNWELDVFQNRVVSSPVIAGGLIFASAGVGGGGREMVAVAPGDAEKGIEAKVAYEIEGSLPYVPTSVARGELLFLWSDQGVVTCLDAPSGKIHWRERVGGRFFGSPVCVGDRLYCMSREGQMIVLAAAEKYKLLAEIDLEEPSCATPSIADGVMYLRTTGHLMAIGGE